MCIIEALRWNLLRKKIVFSNGKYAYLIYAYTG